MVPEAVVISKVARGGLRRMGRTFDRKLDLARVRARRGNEIVFEGFGRAVVNDIDAGVNVVESHLAEGRDVAMPVLLLADEVVHMPRQRFQPFDFRMRIRANQPHSHRRLGELRCAIVLDPAGRGLLCKSPPIKENTAASSVRNKE